RESRVVASLPMVRPGCSLPPYPGPGETRNFARLAERADRDREVPERVDQDLVARLDHRGRIELLHDGGPCEAGPGREPLAAVDGRAVPAVREPRAPAFGEVGPRGRAEQALERHRPAPADDRGAEAHDLRAHLAQLDAEALPVRLLESADEILALDARGR